jgi:hypothetical protein
MKKSQAEILAVLFIILFVSIFVVFFLFFMNPDRAREDDQTHLILLSNAFYSSLFNRVHFSDCTSKYSFIRLIDESFYNESLKCDSNEPALDFIKKKIEASLNASFGMNGISYIFNLTGLEETEISFRSWNCDSGTTYILPTQHINPRGLGRIVVNLKVCK